MDTPTTGNALPTTNKPAQVVRNTVGELTQKGISAAEAALIANQPWLGWPIFKQFWEAAFSYFLTQFGEFLGVASGDLVINEKEYFALQKSAAALVALNAAKAKGDPHEISQASSAADDAAASVIHYVGDSRSS